MDCKYDALKQAHSIADVIHATAAYLASWSRDELERLPDSCRPGWVRSGQDIEFWADRLLAESARAQLFMDDAITDQVHAAQPYASKGLNRMRNSADGIYRDGGDQLLIAPVASGDGYAANFAIGLDLSDTAIGAPDGMQGGPGRPGPARGR